jgi:mono/diheme cytochrome c family protein
VAHKRHLCILIAESSPEKTLEPISPIFLRMKSANTFYGRHISVACLLFIPLWTYAKSEEKPTTPLAPSGDDGVRLEIGAKGYGAACVTCHQPNGEGIPNIYPPLADSEWVKGSEERAISIVLFGLTGPITVKGVTYPGIPMPAFVQGSSFNWTDEQIAAVLTYVRQAWDNKAAPITEGKVKGVRTKTGQRGEMTEEELKKIP